MEENNTAQGSPSGLNIGEILANLSHNDFSFHVTVTALMDVLKDKKNPDGTPFITNEELAEKAKLIQEELAKKVKLSVPPPTGPILPGLTS